MIHRHQNGNGQSSSSANTVSGLRFGLPVVFDSETFAGRAFKDLLKTVTIRSAREDDLRRVNKLEGLLYENQPGASERGFLLSGGSGLEGFKGLLNSTSFLVAETGGQIIGFMLAMPPGHERIRAMLNNEALRLTSPLTFEALKPCAWIGKVGVHPDYMGQGLGSVFYDTILRQFSKFNVLALTTFSPMRNLRSERLHERFGFRHAGYFEVGDRGTLKDVVCLVHLKDRIVGK